MLILWDMLIPRSLKLIKTILRRVWGSHSTDYDLLGCDAVQSARSPPMLRGSASYPSSVCSGTHLHVGSFLISLLDPKHGDDMFLRNVGGLSTDYTMLCTRDRTLQYCYLEVPFLHRREQLQTRRLVNRKGSERWRSRTILKWVYCPATRTSDNSRQSNLARRKGNINSFACLVTLYRVTLSTDEWRTGKKL
jgi:hypothetical protein